MGVEMEELLGLVAVSGGDLKTATAAFTRAAAVAAAAAMEDDSDDSDSSDSEEEEARVAARAKAAKKAAAASKKAVEAAIVGPPAKRTRSASIASEAPVVVGKRKRTSSVASEVSAGVAGGDDWQPTAGLVKPASIKGGGPRVPNAPFHRVSVQEVEEQGLIFDKALADNTYAGTYGESGWGAKASAILSKVKGKDFRHEKTKKKRGTYRGGTIDGNEKTSSFKFAD